MIVVKRRNCDILVSRHLWGIGATLALLRAGRTLIRGLPFLSLSSTIVADSEENELRSSVNHGDGCDDVCNHTCATDNRTYKFAVVMANACSEDNSHLCSCEKSLTAGAVCTNS